MLLQLQHIVCGRSLFVFCVQIIFLIKFSYTLQCLKFLNGSILDIFSILTNGCFL